MGTVSRKEKVVRNSLALRFACLTSLAATLWSAALSVAEPPVIKPDDFPAIHQMIKRQPGEWQWAEIPWLVSVAEAQKKAAAEGKPILFVGVAQGSIIGCL